MPAETKEILLQKMTDACLRANSLIALYFATGGKVGAIDSDCWLETQQELSAVLYDAGLRIPRNGPYQHLIDKANSGDSNEEIPISKPDSSYVPSVRSTS